MDKRTFKYSQKLNDYLLQIESSQSVAERQTAIQLIRTSNDREASRLLMDLYGQIPWRDTKAMIITALGHFTSQKSLEFLIGLASGRTDLDIAVRALGALGKTNTPQAGEFLLSFLQQGHVSLAKEALTALCQISEFPLVEDLESILNSKKHAGLAGLFGLIMLTCSKRGYRRFWPLLAAALENEQSLAADSEFTALIIAASYFGEHHALASLRESEACANLEDNLEDTQLLELACEFSLCNSFRSIDDIALHFDLTNKSLFPAIVRSLSRFAATDVARFLQISEGKMALDLNCLLRALFFSNTARSEENTLFIAQNFQSIGLFYQACLLRQMLKSDSEAIVKLALLLPHSHLLELCQLVKLHHPLLHLQEYLHAGNTDADKTSAVNALVWQCLMAAHEEELVKEIGAFIFAQLVESSCTIAPRLIRALGQIGYVNPDLVAYFARLLTKQSPLNASIYYCIGQLQGKDLSKILFQKCLTLLKTPLSDSKSSTELGMTLKVLAELEDPPAREGLAHILLAQREQHRAPLIRVLARHQTEGFVDFIEECLDSPIFQIKVAAIAAAKINRSGPLYRKLLNLLTHQDTSVRDHAAYSLSSAGDVLQLKAFKILQEEKTRSTALMPFIRNFEINTSGNYSELLQRLRTCLAEEKEPFHHEDIIEAGHNLVDNLLVVLAQHKYELSPQDANALTLKHAIYLEIRKDFPNLVLLSEPIKSMIRNAELTLRNPSLFNSIVDKSTVVIEYVKSIDLILQEKVGSQLFGKNREKTLTGMRSRLIAVGIADKSGNVAALLKNLRCSQQYTSNDFPLAKLLSLVQAISSGKIMASPYKTIDGLRAWAMIILLFARPLKVENFDFSPLVTLTIDGMSEITDLSYRLNSLQEIRNQAAHHGTMLDYGRLMAIRNDCFGVLNTLTTVASAP